MKKGMLACLPVVLLLVTIGSKTHPQSKFDWREMASVGTYNLKTRTFWNNYQSQKDTIKKNILRAQRLGCNMVRIPLNYVPPNDVSADDPTPPAYHHGWPDSNYVGTGKVFQKVGSQDWSSGQYLADIDDLINFCRANNLMVNLILFNYSGNCRRDNWAGDYDGSKWTSYYSTRGGALPDENRVKWFVDACSWADTILSRTLSRLEVCELSNEAYPEDEFLSDTLTYPPTFFMDQFLLEMTNYLHYRWPSIKLMQSLVMDRLSRWDNLKHMLAKVDSGRINRPAGISPYIDSLYAHGKLTFSLYTSLKADTHLSRCYYDYLSIHNYSTYSFKVVIDHILGLGTYQSGKHPYQWVLGEVGFDIGTSHSYETDQSKFYQMVFEAASEMAQRTSLKGIGLWSTFDYNGAYEGAATAVHYGIISQDNQIPVRKRKAATVVRNEFMGYVANSDFKIGPGSQGIETLFNDSPWCNGWSPWYGTSYDEHNYGYEPGYLKLNADPTQRLGWSSLPGGMIRVKPGSSITLAADVTTDSPQAPGARIFLYLSWFDPAGQLISNPNPPSDTSNQVTSAGYQHITRKFEVPLNAYYTAVYLMDWYGTTESKFGNVSFVPDWRPFISFTFDDDISYFPPSDQTSGPLGWTVTYGKATRDTCLELTTPYTIVNSTDTLPVSQITSIRAQPGMEYSAVAFMHSPSATFKLLTLHGDANDYPTTVGSVAVTNVGGSTWGIYLTPSIQSDGPWLQLQFEDGGSGKTRVKEVTVFKHTLQ